MNLDYPGSEPQFGFGFKLPDELSNVRPTQLAAGRALLGWSQDDLAKASGVARRTISDMERGVRSPSLKLLAALKASLEQAGVIFTEDDHGFGVYLRQVR